MQNRHHSATMSNPAIVSPQQNNTNSVPCSKAFKDTPRARHANPQTTESHRQILWVHVLAAVLVAQGIGGTSIDTDLDVR